MNDDESNSSENNLEEDSLEEHYFGQDRKLGKQQRKLASAKDRSKYKKTDRDQQLKHDVKAHEQKLAAAKEESLLRGRVTSIVPEGIMVQSEDEMYTCILRGALKKDKGLDKNLVTVGDFVHFVKISPTEGSIAYVEQRKTVLSRADNLSRRKNQLIASNIDQVIITASVVQPPLKPPLNDRYLIAAQKGGLEPLIVINKIDLLDDPSIDENVRIDQKELYLHLMEAYEQNGIKAIAVSIIIGEGIEDLRRAMLNKASVFSGQSGVGKSSLINVVTGLNLRVGEVVDRTKKGSHTTTTAKFMPLSFGGWCVDTPGIKSFGVWELKLEEIKSFFTEIYTIGKQCHYPDCTHLHESDCAVIQAVENGTISPIRYQSYASLFLSTSKGHVRR